MGLFQGKKQSPLDEEEQRVLRFFDDNFRTELRERAREYFEQAINENSAAFKRDLDTTVASINTELKEHITTQLDAAIVRIGSELTGHVAGQLDARLAEHGKAIKVAQDETLQSLSDNIEAIKKQHQNILGELERNVEKLEGTVLTHESSLTDMIERNKAQVATMEEAQSSALRWLTASAQALHDQHQQMSETLQKNVAEQEAIMIEAFEKNMAQVVEHYLMGAIGDQLDIKSQLPAIIAQMDENKQVIMDDIKL